MKNNSNMKNLIVFTISFYLLSCVQETHIKTVTFKVDMTAVANVEHVGVKGNFTSSPWSNMYPLNDDNNDGIYEGNFSKSTTINQIQFKFVNQYNNYELEGMDNRVISFEYQPETILYEAIFNIPNGIQSKIE